MIELKIAIVHYSYNILKNFMNLNNFRSTPRLWSTDLFKFNQLLDETTIEKRNFTKTALKFLRGPYIISENVIQRNYTTLVLPKNQNLGKHDKIKQKIIWRHDQTEMQTTAFRSGISPTLKNIKSDAFLLPN